MPDPPFVSTFIAIGLLPVAFLLMHAYLAGARGWKHHKLTGAIGIIWDLTMSIGYMLFRTFGGEVGGSSLELTGGILAYFIVHGIVAVIVILLEFVTLYLGWSKWKEKEVGKWHGKVSRVMFVFWWAAFLSGELFYVVYYYL